MDEKDLLRKIDDPEAPWFEKCMAIKEAGDRKMKQMEDVFTIMIFSEKNMEVCGALANALVSICGSGDAVLVRSFGMMLKDENEATRYGGVVGLRLTDGDEYTGELLTMLDSENNADIRRECARTLGGLKNPRHPEILVHELERMAEKPENGGIKSIIQESISKLNGRAARSVSDKKLPEAAPPPWRGKALLRNK